jgi:tetratricopeptide (TPR) repeat protein
LNLSEYTFLLNNPNSVNEKQAKTLESVVDNFPYFQSARALYLKGLYNQDSYKYNFALKQTAAHTTDRSVLFDFITSDEFNIIEKAIYEQKLAQLLEIDVIESHVLHNELENTETEIANLKDEFEIPVVPTVEFDSIADVEFVKAEESLTEAVVLDEVVEIAPIVVKTEEVVLEKITPEKIEPTILVEKETSTEEKLELGKPITFTQSEKHSFQEWLQLTSFKPIERENEKKSEQIEIKSDAKTKEKVGNPSNKQKKIEIIDKFIETNPKIKPAKETAEAPVIPIEIKDTSHLMTETLARVYLEQKKYSKAIQAYEILILKYPEKSIFFADRIKDIKILQQNNQ